MSADDPNVEMIEYVADALGELLDRFTFVGGCAAGLLITDRARVKVRATNDVDVIVEISGLGEYYEIFAPQLRRLGFAESQDVNCRWIYHGIKIDVMPTDESILGFGNEWYREATRTALQVQLPSGKNINLITAPLLLLTKISAFYGRGGGDYQGSHDLEDLIAVVDGRPELYKEVADSTVSVRNTLEDEIAVLLGEPQFTSSIPYHLRPDKSSQARLPVVIDRLRKIAGL